MGTTQRGLEISTDDVEVIAAVDVFTDRLAAIDLGVEAVLVAAAAHPTAAALQLGSAMLWLYGQTAEATIEACRYLEAADLVEPSMNERERATLAALRAWDRGEFLVAVELFEAITLEWPTDLLALKALEFLYYVLGQHHMGARFRAHVERIQEPNRDDADFLAVWAFASELSGAPDRAEELAEAALALRPHTPWAHHALAHVMITRGDPPEALQRLASFLPVWETSGRVILCHNAWHLAVAHLDRLDLAGADAIYDRWIWGVAPDSPGEQIDAISYLWRVEMAGGRVEPARWSVIADHVEGRVHECVFPFLTAHQAYALARAGRADARRELLGTVRARAAQDDGEAVRVWRPIGRPVVEACAAYGAGDLEGAAAMLDPVMAEMTAIGGSDAQDDLFRQAYLTALIAAGRPDDARSYFASMTEWKTGSSPLDEQFSAQL